MRDAGFGKKKKEDILARAAYARFNQKLRDKFDGMHVRWKTA